MSIFAASGRYHRNSVAIIYHQSGSYPIGFLHPYLSYTTKHTPVWRHIEFGTPQVITAYAVVSKLLSYLCWLVRLYLAVFF